MKAAEYHCLTLKLCTHRSKLNSDALPVGTCASMLAIRIIAWIEPQALQQPSFTTSKVC